MAGAEVIQVPPKSVLVLRDVELDMDQAAQLCERLVTTLGHDQFVLLTTFTGQAVEVWGPDDDLLARLQGLLDEQETTMADEPMNALTGVPGGAVQATPDPDKPLGPKRRIPVSGTEDEEGQADGTD